ncbi:MAG: CBM96 family carbohydrate-binding protein [Microbacterium sp.]|uniref:CBM96 family carbohydrate-binding protein n=1 Tax=Microbacterium sp. TaxID=51671 RepID=UPI003F7EAA5A
MSLATASIGAADTAIASPTGPTVSDVTATHPRILATTSRWSALSSQVESDPVSSSLSASAIDAADDALTAPTVTYDKPDGVRLLDVSRTVLDRTYSLAYAWRATQDTKYAERLWVDLAAAAAFPDWNPSHFLDTAEMTHAFAIAYDWGYSYWSSSRRAVLRDAIVRLGLTPGAAAYASAGASWPTDVDNVNLVNNSGMLLGALAIAGDSTSALPAAVLDAAYASLQNGLGAYHPDGGFPEGPTYWEYATRYLVTLASALSSSTGSTWGLAETPGIAETARFMQALTGPSGSTFGFADSALRPQPGAAYAGLGRLLGDGSLTALAADSGSSAWPVQQLIWRDAAEALAAPPVAPVDAQFDVGITTMRGNPSDSQSSFAGFRSASEPTGPHQHIDGGDFNFQALGQEWAADLGLEPATYDLLDPARPDNRWKYYRMASEGHNTLTASPFSGDHALAAGTSLIRSGADPESAFAVSNLTPMFASVTDWRRGVQLFDSRTQLLVQDEIAVPSPTEFMWSMHTSADVSLSADRRSATLYLNGQRLLARIVSTDTAEFTLMAAEPLPTSPHLDDEPNTGVRKLAAFFTVSGVSTFAVQLTPLAAGAAPAAVSALTPLSQWRSDSAPSVLAGVTLNGVALPSFAPATTDYRMPTTASAMPVVAATATGGSVVVQQATSTTRVAKVTATQPGRDATTYTISFPLSSVGTSTLVASSVASGWASATVDGKSGTYWGATSGSYIRWELAEPTDLRSIRLSWRAPLPAVSFRVETSVDRQTWTKRFEGNSGSKAVQVLSLGSVGNVKHVRLTLLTSGQLAEAEFFNYNVATETYTPPPTTAPAKATIAAPTRLDVGEVSPAGLKVTSGAGTVVQPDLVRWVSSDPDRASVSTDGMVTAQAGGEARIGAMAWTNGVALTASSELSVVDSTRVRIYASADSYVQSSTPSTNFGTQYGMLAKPPWNGTPDRVAYVRFDLSSLAGQTVTAAVLTAQSSFSEATPDVVRMDAHIATESWAESTITYSNRPLLGRTVGSFLANRTSQFTSADISQYVASFAEDGAGELTLGLTQDDVGAAARLVTIATKESGSPAYIDVTLAPQALELDRADATAGAAAAAIDDDVATYWDSNGGTANIRLVQRSASYVGSLVIVWRGTADGVPFRVESSEDGLSWVPRFTGARLGTVAEQRVALGAARASKYIRLTFDARAVIAELDLFGYDITAPAAVLPPRLLKSVSVAGVPSQLELGDTADAVVSARDSLGDVLGGVTTSFSSSNQAVATVSSTGRITAKAVGAATISVTTSANGLTASTSVPVTVVDSTRVRIYATADSYVQSSTPTTNFGTQYGMLVKPTWNGTADRIAYLRFDLSSLSGMTVTSAVLNAESVFSEGTTPDVVRVDAHVATGPWAESTLNYSNKPALGATVASFPSTRVKQYGAADITSYLASYAADGAGQLTLGLTQDDAGANARLVTVSSRESGRPAYIDITIAPAPAAGQ